MREAVIDLRKWINNDTALMAQVREKVSKYILWMHSSAWEQKKVLGMTWKTLDDCLTVNAKGFYSTLEIQLTRKEKSTLTSDEMDGAEIYLIKQVHLGSFYTEIRAMQNGDGICNKSKVLNLSPFLDKRIIRVGGILKHSQLLYWSKPPISAPAKK
ncbi:hypothetical protein TNCV_3199071 [Trichonephila clavipes]|nr:hypothetical protein TNCV_3199071 [Trichonephila clavipes]